MSGTDEQRTGEQEADRSDGAAPAPVDAPLIGAQTIEARVRVLEHAMDAVIAGQGAEIRTRRLAIVDDEGRERVIGAVVRDQAELRVDAPASGCGEPSSVVMYACPDDGDLGPSCGIQIWVGGNAMGGVDAWPGSDGTWQLHVNLPT